MEFRWVIIVNEYGKKSEPQLQYRRIYSEGMPGEWQDVPVVEIKENDIDDG